MFHVAALLRGNLRRYACVLEQPYKKAMALPHLASDLQTAFRQMHIAFAHLHVAVTLQGRHGLGNARLGYAQVFGNVNRPNDALVLREHINRFEIVFSGFT